MYERFTDRARRAVVLATDESRPVAPEHVLVGLLLEGESDAARVLTERGVTVDGVRGLTRAVPAGSFGQLTEHTKKLFELSLREALMLGHTFVGCEHLVLGMVRQGEGCFEILSELGGNPVDTRKALIARLVDRHKEAMRPTSETSVVDDVVRWRHVRAATDAVEIRVHPAVLERMPDIWPGVAGTVQYIGDDLWVPLIICPYRGFG